MNNTKLPTRRVFVDSSSVTTRDGRIFEMCTRPIDLFSTVSSVNDVHVSFLRWFMTYYCGYFTRPDTRVGAIGQTHSVVFYRNIAKINRVTVVWKYWSKMGVAEIKKKKIVICLFISAIQRRRVNKTRPSTILKRSVFDYVRQKRSNYFKILKVQLRFPCKWRRSLAGVRGRTSWTRQARLKMIMKKRITSRWNNNVTRTFVDNDFFPF